jgi:hypothetical protein
MFRGIEASDRLRLVRGFEQALVGEVVVLEVQVHLHPGKSSARLSATALLQDPPQGCTALTRLFLPQGDLLRPGNWHPANLASCVPLALSGFLDLSRVQLPHDTPHDSVGYSGHFGYFTYGKAVSPQLHDAINRRRFIA